MCRRPFSASPGCPEPPTGIIRARAPVLPPYSLPAVAPAYSLPCLIPRPFDERVRWESTSQGSNVPNSVDDRTSARGDLAWAISVGGIGVVGFAALLLF